MLSFIHHSLSEFYEKMQVIVCYDISKLVYTVEARLGLKRYCQIYKELEMAKYRLDKKTNVCIYNDKKNIDYRLHY